MSRKASIPSEHATRSTCSARLDPSAWESIDAAARAEVESAFEAALAAPEAGPEVAFEHVWVE